MSSTSVSTETSVITTVASAAAAASQSEGTLLSNSNTSLIKTLLASKVCDPKLNVPSATIKLSNNESCTLYASSQNCNSTVITEVSVLFHLNQLNLNKKLNHYINIGSRS